MQSPPNERIVRQRSAKFVAPTAMADPSRLMLSRAELMRSSKECLGGSEKVKDQLNSPQPRRYSEFRRFASSISSFNTSLKNLTNTSPEAPKLTTTCTSTGSGSEYNLKENSLNYVQFPFPKIATDMEHNRHDEKDNSTSGTTLPEVINCEPAKVYETRAFDQIADNVFIVYASARVFRGIGVINRNMVVIRKVRKDPESKERTSELTLVNPIRLDEKGTTQLHSIGTVVRLIRLAPDHGMAHDMFYLNEYPNDGRSKKRAIERWAVPSENDPNVVHKKLTPRHNGKFILPRCQLYAFQHLEEAVLLVQCTDHHKIVNNVLVSSRCLQAHLGNSFVNIPVRVNLIKNGLMSSTIVIPNTVLRKVKAKVVGANVSDCMSFTADNADKIVPATRKHFSNGSTIGFSRPLRDDFQSMLRQLDDFDQFIGSSGVFVPSSAKENVVLAIEQAFPIWD